MFYSDEIIEEVRNANDIVDVIGRYVTLKKTGSSYFGLCPFHNEKSPSFSVSPRKQMFYCFGCGQGGNVLTFLMKYENLSFTEAMQSLADSAGIALPKQEFTKEQQKAFDLKNRIIEINTEAAKFYYHNLASANGDIAKKYFESRQLKPETIVKFGLGYSPKYGNTLYNYLKSKGYSDDELKETMLFNYNEKNGVSDRFWNRVMFPIMDVNNRVIAFGGRVLGEGKPKYLNSPETKVFDKSRNLYGLNIARTSRKDYLLICEGYMDVISLHQAGFDNAVAALGTAFNSRHAMALKRYTKEVVLTFDSDDAGNMAALRAIPYLREAGFAIKVLDMKPYKDPDEFIKNLGVEEYQRRIDNAINYFIFQVMAEEKKYNLNDPQEKTKFHKSIAEMLVVFEDDIERENYIDSVCEKFSISKDALNTMVKRMLLAYDGKDYKTVEEKVERKKTTKDADVMIQRILLSIMMDDVNCFEKVSKIISPEDFTSEFYHKVANAFWEQMESGSGNPAKIMDQFDDDEEHSKVANLFVSPFPENTEKSKKEKAINDAVYKLKKKSIDNALLKAGEENDMAAMQKLINEQKELGKLFISL